MRRFARRLFAICATLSLLLFVAVVVAAARGEGATGEDRVVFETRGFPRAVTLTTGRGGLTLIVRRHVAHPSTLTPQEDGADYGDQRPPERARLRQRHDRHPRRAAGPGPGVGPVSAARVWPAHPGDGGGTGTFPGGRSVAPASQAAACRRKPLRRLRLRPPRHAGSMSGMRRVAARRGAHAGTRVSARVWGSSRARLQRPHRHPEGASATEGSREADGSRGPEIPRRQSASG